MEIFSLFGSILLKDEGVEGKLDDIETKAQKTSGSFGSMIGSVAKWGAGLAVALGGIALASIGDAAEAESSLAQLDAVLESTGGAAGVTRDELTDLADALEGTTKFSAESTQAAESLLLTFTNIGKDVFPDATKTALDMATALGGDAAGQSIALGKALNDPINGITALSRVGVSFSEDQKSVIKKLQETGDMAGAQKIILAELNKEFGGSAEAAGKTFAGQLEIAKNAMGNVTETIGTALLPKMTEFLNWVTPHLPAIANFFTNVFGAIGSVVGGATDVFQKNFMPIIQGVSSFIQTNWPAIQATSETVFNAIITVVKTLWDFFKTNILPIYKEVYDYVMLHMPEIQSTMQSVFDAILLVVTGAWTFFKENLLPIIAGLYNMISSYMPQIETIVSGVFTVIKNVVTIVWDIFKNLLLPILKALWDFISPTFPLIGDVVKAAFDIVIGVVEDVVSVFEKVTGAIKTAIDWLKSWNSTPASSKNVSTSSKLSKNVPEHAGGTDNFEGGLTWVNELGGEILDLPSGTRIIPHDVSMEMAKNSAINRKSTGGLIVQFINQGTVVGSGGMKELAKIVSGEIANTYGLSTGGDF